MCGRAPRLKPPSAHPKGTEPRPPVPLAFTAPLGDALPLSGPWTGPDTLTVGLDTNPPYLFLPHKTLHQRPWTFRASQQTQADL